MDKVEATEILKSLKKSTEDLVSFDNDKDRKKSFEKTLEALEMAINELENSF
ncbi:hypothetical protein ACSXAY_10240 [Clostridium perfringens]